jgi:hypothetical protein
MSSFSKLRFFKIVMHRIDQFRPGESVNPRLVRSPACAHFGDNDQTILVWMQRLLDDPICYVRAIEIAGIDVVHAGVDGFAQHPDGLFGVARRSPHLRTGQLHGAIAHAAHRHGRVREREGSTKISLYGHLVAPTWSKVGWFASK